MMRTLISIHFLWFFKDTLSFLDGLLAASSFLVRSLKPAKEVGRAGSSACPLVGGVVMLLAVTAVRGEASAGQLAPCF